MRGSQRVVEVPRPATVAQLAGWSFALGKTAGCAYIIQGKSCRHLQGRGFLPSLFVFQPSRSLFSSFLLSVIVCKYHKLRLPSTQGFLRCRSDSILSFFEVAPPRLLPARSEVWGQAAWQFWIDQKPIRIPTCRESKK